MKKGFMKLFEEGNPSQIQEEDENKKGNKMNRFFGMMPAKEISIRKSFKVGWPDDGDRLLTVYIDAGKNGWTITYADYSTKYNDVTDTDQNNFNTALEILKKQFPIVKEVKHKDKKEDIK